MSKTLDEHAEAVRRHLYTGGGTARVAAREGFEAVWTELQRVQSVVNFMGAQLNGTRTISVVFTEPSQVAVDGEAAAPQISEDEARRIVAQRLAADIYGYMDRVVYDDASGDGHTVVMYQIDVARSGALSPVRAAMALLGRDDT